MWWVVVGGWILGIVEGYGLLYGSRGGNFGDLGFEGEEGLVLFK